MSTPRWGVLALLLAGPLVPAFQVAADNAPNGETKGSVEVAVSVVSVADIRSGDSFSGLTIEFALAGYPAGRIAAARVQLRKAVDDTGRDLLPSDSRRASLEAVHDGRSSDPEGKPDPAVVEVKLRNPARKAKMLAELSGEIELFLPGSDPNSVVIVPDLPAHEGKRLESPALEASGVGISVLTAEQLEVEKKSRAEKRKEEARSHGMLAEMLEPIGSAFAQAFFNPESGDVVLKVDDPGDRIVKMSLLDAAGEDRTTGRSEQQGLVVLSSTRTGPGPGRSLEVRLSTPKSLERRSFAFRNVALP